MNWNAHTKLVHLDGVTWIEVDLDALFWEAVAEAEAQLPVDSEAGRA